MRKGDARREQILRTAEALFYAQGYEQTSVQDILDAIGISKGGFYHHFESKLDLLDAICQQRAEESARAAQKAAESVRGNPPAELNALVSCSGLLRAESLDYISLLLRVAWREDGALMREKLKQRTMTLLLPSMNEIIAEGVESGVFSLPRPSRAGSLVLRLGAQFTDEAAEILAGPGEKAEKLSDIYARLELYRHTVERMLGAPFGSITLYDMRHLAEVCEGLENQQKL